ncbi:hypothetical protein [Croceibacterium aestuarii]|uniref:hypothetical protein n=1 Tax=Croceibacterium aestuarii TaxID=3064139 RepID=UPI00272EE5BF|nr:hypothetical protein [Croceibacterium sp. D39]
MGRIFTSASMLALVFSTPAMAQQTNPDKIKIAELEKRLAAEEAVLRELRAEIDKLRGAPPPLTPEQVRAALPDGCALASDEARRAVIANPAVFEGKCFTGVPKGPPDTLATGDASAQTVADASLLAPAADVEASALYDQAATSLPGRALSPAGFVPQVAFGKDSEASLKLSVPLNLRNCYYHSAKREQSDLGCNAANYDGHSPRTFTPFVAIATALDSKLGKVFSTQDGVGDLDITSKTSIQVGFDFVQYGKVDASDARDVLDAFLDKQLADACREDKHRVCIGDEALLWALAADKDGNPKHRDLLNKLSGLLWLPLEEKPKPLFGFGGSAKIGTQTYKFYPAAGSVGPDKDYAHRQAFTLDRAMALGTKDEVEHQNLKIEAHAFGIVGETKGSKLLRGYSPGAMLLAQVSYLRDWSIPDDAKDVQICETVPANQLLKCGTYNFLAPRKFTTWTLAGEIRAEFLNLRGIGALGVAPRFEYAFDGDRKIFDLPFYIGGSSGSGGIKLTRSFDGRDVLGQPTEDSTTISIFFSPLTFSWP